MRGLDLPHRRYSMPETIMRKFRLGQSSSSSENSSRSSTRQRRHRRKPQAGRKVDRSSQTSPAIVVDRYFGSDTNLNDGGPLLDSSPSLLNRRATSVPDLSSSSSPLSPDGRKFSRPTSASGLGTPSPSRVSCYGPPGHGCALCSNSWSFTSSDYTLTQTVSDRTTSTQDSTLSVKSTSPSTPTPVSWTAEQALILENSMFQPAGNIIAVHTESILINPLTIVDSSDNWNFGFAADDVESRLAMAPHDAATSTEDDIGAITSGRRDRSTSIDRKLEQTVTAVRVDGSPIDRPPVNKPPEISADDCSDGLLKTADVKRCQKNQKTQYKSALKNSRSFPPNQKKCRADAEVAVNGGNYKDIKAESAIARYSAVPRSNSMIVNTSSVDYTSDSDLSLTDSLEDVNDKSRDSWPPTRHDDRLVRGEVSVDYEKNRKRLPKSGDAYAYFLSFSGEQDMIKSCHAPDWLRARLKRREEEIRRHFEVKLNRRCHQTIVYRRRRRTVADMNGRGHGGHKPKKPVKAVKWDDRTNETPTTVVNVVQQVPNAAPVATKDELLSDPDPTAPTPVQNVGNPSPENPSFFHISEVIKIEMSNQLKTIITKEKQINLNHDAFLREGKSIQTSEIINNEDAHNSQKIIMRTNVGNFEIGQNQMIDLPGEAALEPPKEIEAGTQTAPDAGTQTVPECRLVPEIGTQTIPEVGTQTVPEKPVLPEIGTQTVPEKPIVPEIGTQTVPEVGTQTVTEFPLVPEVGTQTVPEVGTQTVPEVGTQTVPEIIAVPQIGTQTVPEVGTQTVPEAPTQTSACGHFRSLLAKPKIQSFRHFLPLFESKADDQTVADVLLSAMREERILPGKKSVQQQTASSSCSDEGNFATVESSCNTYGPYLSESVQTGESFLGHRDRIEPARVTSDKCEQCAESSIDRIRTEILQTENKECNTEAFSIPAVVQTRETADGSFVEAEKDEVTMISQLAKDKGTDVYLEEPEGPTANKSCNTANPLIDGSCNTDSLIVSDVKPTVVSEPKLKRRDVQFERGVQQTSKSIKKVDRVTRQKRDTPTPYCTRPDPNSTQVLELNVPPCTCHMCTFHKRAHSTAETTSRAKTSGKQALESVKDKKLPKFPPGSRRNLSKFHRKFDVIPEEKASSTESIAGDGRNVDESTETAKLTITTGTMTKDPGKHVSIQEPPEPKIDDTTQTSADAAAQKKVVHQVNAKKSNLVIGRFRAIPDHQSEEGEGSSSDLGRLPDGLEVVRQYKGRAALATSSTTGQEELLTLSKGWINFYLLKDNQDPDDVNGESGYHVEGAKIDETVQEYTLEIRATPEPDYRECQKSRSKSGCFPDIPTRDVKRRHKAAQVNRSNGPQVTTLPDIHNSSSSSSTPEGHLDDFHLSNSSKARRQRHHALPDVHGTRSARHEIKARRERREEVTAISKTEPAFKVPPDLEHNLETSHSTKAVEVARSEHSVSSITSSTVILSESPSPQQLQTFSDRKIQKRSAIYSERNGIEGSSWTVTVAGSSGVTNQTPPDVEMRLTFAKPNNQDQDNQECGMMQYNSHQSHHISRSKRQGKMQIEEYKHSLRNERHSLQYVPELRTSKKERGRVEVNQNHDEDLSSRMSPRSKCSEAFSEEGELQVTGLAITPELKPRVPTQSERDLVRRQRYKFTR
ncbi:Hypothetical protein NTJ_06802 [Nesidiocoris tenuis]|uniref:Uncharacterized protein n=1 Tax=Nesidiocoris tenuis TaxID=355587 RepID=A0ABN7APJ6_9HEMI|nr:Hypothetical protein NTJ_06802 [Nesidiocoris tenuis]